MGLRGREFGIRHIFMKHWLVKSEPESYSWQNLLADKKTSWTGVRNFQARNNLKAMKKGDRVFFYHSVTEKAVVGIAEVVKEAYPDPTAKEGDWVCVEIAPIKTVKRPVTLDEIKTDKSLAKIQLITHSRLSVQPLGDAEFEKILRMAETKDPV